MFKSLAKLIKSMFPAQKSNLEEYIISNRPQSILDVEYLEMKYSQKSVPTHMHSYDKHY